MTIRIFIGLIAALAAIFYAPVCRADQASNVQKKPELQICKDIMQLYKDKRIREIVIGEGPTYDRPKVPNFFADIDNDGVDEEFNYFTTSQYVLVMQILNGEIRPLPEFYKNSGTFTGNEIIKYKGRFYQLHFDNGPSELQEIRKKTDEELRDPNDNPHGLFKAKSLCKFDEE